jgi:DNA invertase Pin-like site-specific DNA recombinase
VALGLSGAFAYEDRPDLRLVEEEIGAARCAHLLVREQHVLARNALTAAQMAALLASTGTTLHVASLGWALDLADSNDRLNFHVCVAIRDAEHAMLQSRLRHAMESKYVRGGKPWPGVRKFGFRRRPDEALEVDPDTWPLVQFVFASFASGKKIAAIEAELRRRGVEMTRERIRSILCDPIYVDGSISVAWNGARHALPRIPLGKKGIARSVFGTAQRLLAAQSSTRRGNRP